MPHTYGHTGSSTGTSDSSSTRQSATNAQGQVAPPGFHYMPDGTLMSDVEHARLFGSNKVLKKNKGLGALIANSLMGQANVPYNFQGETDAVTFVTKLAEKIKAGKPA